MRLMTVEESRQFLNNCEQFNPIRRVQQSNGEYFTVYPIDSRKLFFVEVRDRNGAKWIGCPNPPTHYLIANRNKVTKIYDYGRALRFMAALVTKGV